LKVRIKTSLAGLDFSYVNGDEAELPDEMAKSWIKAGVAESGEGFVVVDDQENTENAETENGKQTQKEENMGEDEEERPSVTGIKHVGGGWYELSNGEKVHGKQAATEAFETLKA
jgi:hypothetical protein